MYKDSESRLSIALALFKGVIGSRDGNDVVSFAILTRKRALTVHPVAVFKAGDEDSHPANPYAEHSLAKHINVHARP